MIVMTPNVKGICASFKKRTIGRLLDLQEPYIILLHETILERVMLLT